MVGQGRPTLEWKPRRVSTDALPSEERFVLKARVQRPRARGLVMWMVVAAAMTAGAALDGAARAEAPARVEGCEAARGGRVETIQVADEIVRRLRRLGINFSKTRLSHPYDPDGEIC
jgi:hypothetical protein